jgi:hypothetical protein
LAERFYAEILSCGLYLYFILKEEGKQIKMLKNLLPGNPITGVGAFPQSTTIPGFAELVEGNRIIWPGTT